MVARWSIDAKFGYKQNVIDLMQRWAREIGPQAGLTADKLRLITGSIGALEATIQSEVVVKDLAELNQIWEKLGAIAAQAMEQGPRAPRRVGDESLGNLQSHRVNSGDSEFPRPPLPAAVCTAPSDPFAPPGARRRSARVRGCSCRDRRSPNSGGSGSRSVRTAAPGRRWSRCQAPRCWSRSPARAWPRDRR